MKKLFKTFLLSLLILAMVFCLTACKDNPANTDKDNSSPDGQIPVYTGMEVSSDVPVVPSSLSSFKLLSASSMSNKNFHGDSKPDKDKDKEETDKNKPFPNKPSVEEEIKSSLNITGAEKKTYYAKANEDIFVTILIDNPDQYEIVSFTLNDKKYSSYMFEKGSDMEHLILKVDVGSAIGFKSYTIDAIKYIDKTEIKDVLMNGDKSIEIGVGSDNLVNLNVQNTNAELTSISFDCALEDDHSIISNSNGYVKAVLYDGENLIFKELEIGNEKVVFDNLKQDTLYQLSIIGYFDDLTGSGKTLNTLYSEVIYTNAIVLFDNIDITQSSASWDFLWYDKHLYKEITKLELFLNNEKIKDLATDTLEIDNLFSNSTYKIIATYKNTENKDEQIELEFTTIAKIAPTISITDLTSSSTNIKFNIDIEDPENVGELESIELYQNKEFIKSFDMKKLTIVDEIEFDGLLSGFEYEIIVKYSYNLNDNTGTNYVTDTKVISTTPKQAPRVVFYTSSIQYENATTFSFKSSFIILHDEYDTNLELQSVSLYSGETLIVTHLPSEKYSFTGLLSNTEYIIVVSYTYDLNDGEGTRTAEKSQEIRTAKKYEPSIVFENIDRTYNSISFNFKVSDPYETNVKLEKILYRVMETPLSSYTDITAEYDFESKVIITDLLPDTEYEIVVRYSYNLTDGRPDREGNERVMIKTSPKTAPTINIEAFPSQDKITINMTVLNPHNVDYRIEGFELYKEGTRVDFISSNKRVFSEVLSDTEYTVKVIYRYFVETTDGLKEYTEENQCKCKTLKKEKPTMNLSLTEITETSVSYSLDIIDPDNTGKIAMVRLFKENKFLADYELVESGTISNLLPNTLYKITIRYGYTLNNGHGSDPILKEQEFYTLPTLKLLETISLSNNDLNVGDTACLQFKVENIHDLEFTKVVINNKEYNVEQISTATDIFVNIPIDNSYTGGNVSLTITKIFGKVHNLEYSFDMTENNSATIFVIGDIEVKYIQILNKSNSKPEYLVIDEEFYLNICIHNVNNYTINSITINATEYNNFSYVNVDTIRITIKNTKVGEIKFNLNSINYTYKEDKSTTKSFLISTDTIYGLYSKQQRKISSIDDFMNMEPWYHYELMCDIDLTNLITPGNQRDFCGYLDGNGCTINITNISTYTQIDLSSFSLFRNTNGIIKNVNITGTIIATLKYVATTIPMTDEDVYIGTLASHASGNYSNISTNVNVSIKLETYNFSQFNIYCGGLFAESSSATTSNCFSMGNISIDASEIEVINMFIGGLVSFAKNSTITDSFTTGNISVLTNSNNVKIGKFVGEKINTSLINCYKLNEQKLNKNNATVSDNAFATNANADTIRIWVFKTWDLNIWELSPDGYPVLKSQVYDIGPLT